MNDIGFKALILALLDASGLSKFLTSLSATILSFGIHNVAQLVAVSVAIVSGCMAIRHYAIATQLNKAKLKKMQSQKVDGLHHDS